MGDDGADHLIAVLFAFVLERIEHAVVALGIHEAQLEPGALHQGYYSLNFRPLAGRHKHSFTHQLRILFGVTVDRVQLDIKST